MNRFDVEHAKYPVPLRRMTITSLSRRTWRFFTEQTYFPFNIIPDCKVLISLSPPPTLCVNIPNYDHLHRSKFEKVS